MQAKAFGSGYHHHWKLMTLVIAVVGTIVFVSFIQGWLLLATMLALGLTILVVQWLTIDPPTVTDEDVEGPSAKKPSEE